MNKQLRLLISLLFLGTAIFILNNSASFSDSTNQVHVIALNDDTINPVTAEYIAGSIDRAEEENAQCLIIQMDTPGGLLSSTRSIVKKMLTAKVPVVVYIAPSGSRAGSAGVFITYASHVAAMAPSTNIGAAHPVQMGQKAPQRSGEWKELRELIEELKEKDGNRGKISKRDKKKKEEDATEIKPDESPLESKILNDTVAFIKTIAEKRNRNVEWGVESVVKSASITESEALEKGVVEIVAQDLDDLLIQLDGRTVMISGEEIALATKGADVQQITMDSRQKFFNVLANPNIAYFLMILGFYGLLFEVTHPGIGVPGILGIIFLILAFYSMQTLPTNYAGLALFALGLILLVAEAYIPGFGLLTLGGLVCLILGSMLLFESTDPVMRVSKSAIYAFSLTTAAITFFLVRSVIKTRKSKVLSGREELIGATAEVHVRIPAGKKGKVYVHGEIWNATSDETIKKGEPVSIVKVYGLNLIVKKL